MKVVRSGVRTAATMGLNLVESKVVSTAQKAVALTVSLLADKSVEYLGEQRVDPLVVWLVSC